jgi:Tfp pilus assembly protein PilX
MRHWFTLARERLDLREERGIALIMAIGILFVLSISLGTVLYVTSASARHAEHSNAGQKAYALAEAGLDNALAVLNTKYPSTSVYPGDTPPGTFLPTRVTTYNEGKATWSGTLQFVNAPGWTWEWAITSIGEVANPTGPGTANVTRTIKAKVPVVMPPEQPVGSDGTLNWIYAGDSARFTNSVSIASPVYTWRHLSLENGAHISGIPGISGVVQKLAVGGGPAGGNLTMEQKADTVGEDAPLAAVHINGLCASKTVGPTLHNCIWGGTGANPHDQVWGTIHDNTVPPNLIIKPELTCCSPVAGSIAPTPPAGTTSQMGFWYQNAQLGPYIPCNGPAAPRQPVFETGDNTINNSATPSIPFNLTPSTGDYTCKNVVGGQTLGELTWNATTKKLKLKGTMYIDGSATVDSVGYSGNPVFEYDGQGTLVLSGTFAVKNAKICAVVKSNDCDVAAGAWDPNNEAFIVVADGDGGNGGAQSQGNIVDAGNGIQLKGSSFQGALIANKDIEVETTSDEQGPMISVYNWVVTGQTGVLTFPAVHFAPSGGGGITQPLPPAQLLAPQHIAAG